MVNEKKLREEFESSKDLQVEFGDDFGAFFALKKHEDEVAKQAERRARRRERKTETKIDESQLRAEFAASADLRSEFGGDINSFLAFKRGEGKKMVMEREGGRSLSAPGQKKTEKIISGKESHIAAEAARRAEKIRQDELEQVAAGMPCDVDGVPIES